MSPEPTSTEAVLRGRSESTDCRATMRRRCFLANSKPHDAAQLARETSAFRPRPQFAGPRQAITSQSEAESRSIVTQENAPRLSIESAVTKLSLVRQFAGVRGK